MLLTAEKEWFKDAEGRSVLLRGVNLGGSSKVPAPDGATHMRTDFSDSKDVSFVGRPFPLEEADEHFSRLQKWGFNCLRVLITWEAIEHGGPGVYDTAYLDYLRAIIEKAGEYGFYVFIDPHQDVWSRMTGGDGAPGWLFEKVGLNVTAFDATEAALVMQYRYPEYEPMCWSQNYSRFAAATMFTLFFGGTDFAPHCLIEGEPVQEYMQTHYINAVTQVAEQLKDLPHVMGYECLNEPHPGFIGVDDLTVPIRVAGQIMPGLQISPFDGMVSSSGISRAVKVAELKRLGVKITGETIINPGKVSCWLHDRDDIWQKESIWEPGHEGPLLLHPHHFGILNGNPVHFFADYLTPFINRYAVQIRNNHPDTFIFIEGEPYHTEPMKWGVKDAQNVVNASHWYDGVTLITRRFSTLYNYDITTGSLVLTQRGIRKMFERQLRRMKEASARMQNIPTVIGEFGIPFDMNNKEAYRTGDFSSQVTALAMNYDTLDSLLLHSTLWNYTADNTNQWGDQWNLEDLSIFSRDQQRDNDIGSGGRAIKGFCRPYARKTAGTPRSMSFNLKSGRFTFIFEADLEASSPTEIFVPGIQYPRGVAVTITSGQFERRDDSLLVYADAPGECTVEISRI
ncbi:MAG: cellulase family glycosylhydrolase [Theionarchaea archaeon]|nr:cellulase family glycosylhydrolase [Theionarchaea archaeon]MBU7020632.1 cellulase family glycosylhydrolase [Theionarchaea archaeon]MBU7035201.1 cellulase family glycosylhydrolase [Theionarchaea archaeon]